LSVGKILLFNPYPASTPELESLVRQVPVDQRPIADAKIRQAELQGFTEIRFSHPDNPWNHHSELIGLSPQGNTRPMPDPERTGA